MGWMAGVRFLAGTRDFSLFHSVRLAVGSTQLPIQWVSGALSLGLKQQGHEADHSPPLTVSAEVKNGVAVHALLQMSYGIVFN
jgi:hypothetical protein